MTAFFGIKGTTMAKKLYYKKESLEKKRDEALVELTFKDPEIFGELIKRYSSKIYYYIYRLLNKHSLDAEDLTQDTFIKAYQNLASFNTKLKFSSWIYRIAHNEAVNYIKKNYRYPIHSIEQNEYLKNTLESDENILERIIKHEDDSLVLDVLARLSVKYRAPIELYYFENKSYLEIADILHISINSVGPTIRRAKKKLKIIIKEFEDGKK